MLKIAICDDEEIFLKTMKDTIKNFFNRKNFEIEIECFFEAKTLFNCDMNEFNIFFLDIELDCEYDGIKLAEYIRAYNNNAIIVFITAHIKYAIHGYTVKAFRYLLKNHLREDLSVCLEDILQEVNIVPATFFVPTTNRQLLVKDIMYFEAKDHYIGIYLNDGKHVDFIGTLYNVEKNLISDIFVRVQRSYIVNINYIVSIKNRNVYLRDGYVIGCSRKNYQEIVQRYLLWEGR